MAGESDSQTPGLTRTPPGLTRRTMHSPLRDGRMWYYPAGGGVSVVMPPSRLGRWYERVNDWGETLIDFVEKLEEILYRPRPQPSTGHRDFDGSEIPTQFVQVLYLLRKAGHVLLLAAYAIGYLLCAILYLVYLRIKHLLGCR